MAVLLGSTPDISPLMQFHWWEPVYYKLHDSDFPSKSPEKCGHFVGFAEHVGHAMIYKILTDDTQKVIWHSNVRSALDPAAPNLQIEPSDGETPTPFIRSKSDLADDGEIKKLSMPLVDPSDLIGWMFLMDP